MEIVDLSKLHEAVPSKVAPAVRKSGASVWKMLAVVAGLTAVVWQFYYFRELAAALLIFTILFLMIAGVIGAIYLIGRIGQKGIAIAEPAARRGLVFAEVISRKTFHRPRSAPVQ